MDSVYEVIGILVSIGTIFHNLVHLYFRFYFWTNQWILLPIQACQRNWITGYLQYRCLRNSNLFKSAKNLVLVKVHLNLSYKLWSRFCKGFDNALLYQSIVMIIVQVFKNVLELLTNQLFSFCFCENVSKSSPSLSP